MIGYLLLRFLNTKQTNKQTRAGPPYLEVKHTFIAVYKSTPGSTYTVHTPPVGIINIITGVLTFSFTSKLSGGNNLVKTLPCLQPT